ncbi:uncharacterized protein LOC129729544 [Wyeomyia smithii]|uniref:uncharacterized protein LOC129729544 n=1 Tax=Wyeomyia smithii TaxID=174621 RepID=UPI002467EA0C|nr:uncharacterized protein LOC129729544 [Wyeomyia smithii]
MTSRRLWQAVTLSAIVALIDQGDIVVGLECHFCIGMISCNRSGEEIETMPCTAEIVHRTNESLASFMPTLVKTQVLNREEFQCVHVKATSLSDRTFLFIRGCVYATVSSIEFCDLRHASFQGTRECVACNREDRCNDVILSGSERNVISAITMVGVFAVLCVVNHVYLRLNV